MYITLIFWMFLALSATTITIVDSAGKRDIDIRIRVISYVDTKII
jgi:hypothetical protein